MVRHSRSPVLHAEPRHGGALVEFAICLPLLMMLIFGSIEAANAIFLRQALAATAYEAAQVACNVGGQSSTARQRANQVLKARNVKSGKVTFSPNVSASTKAGTTITVKVSAPATSNAISPLWFFQSATLESTVVMVKL